jgi:hypothetical protein
VSRGQSPFPARPFGLLLVEGGDERAACQAVAGAAAWTDLVCWWASGRDDLKNLARLAARDPSFYFARSVGVVLDVENNPTEAHAIAAATLAVFGATGTPAHGVVAGAPRRFGAFIAPDGVSHGCLETLCRQAIGASALAACVDALVTCAGTPHASRSNARAAEDKAWLKAYLAMLPDPTLRFHQAFGIPGGIDAANAAFDPLRTFLLAL